MLILSRKLDESILIGGDIRVMVTSIQGNTVMLGIDAPRHITITRDELIARPARRHDADDSTAALKDSRA